MNPIENFFGVLGLFAGSLAVLSLVVSLFALTVLILAVVVDGFRQLWPGWRIKRKQLVRYGSAPYRLLEVKEVVTDKLTSYELLIMLSDNFCQISTPIFQKIKLISRSCVNWLVGLRVFRIWQAYPIQLVWRYGLTLAVLLGCMWSSTFLFGGTPPTITRVGQAFSTEPIFSGFAISRLWDIPTAFLAVAAVVGSLWLFNRFVCGDTSLTKKNLAFSVKLFALFVVPLTALGWSGLASSSGSFFSVLTTLLRAAIQMTCLVFWLILIGGAIRQSHPVESCHLWQNTNAHQLGVAVFSLLTITGVMIGLFFWGLPLGLMIGLGSGLVGGLLTTCTAYIFTIFLRLMEYLE